MSPDPTTVTGTETNVIDEDGETLFREPEVHLREALPPRSRSTSRPRCSTSATCRSSTVTSGRCAT